MDKEIKIAIVILGIVMVIIAPLSLYFYENPCQEYKTSCHYGTRNTHPIECNASIDSVPEGYSISRVRSCVKR